MKIIYNNVIPFKGFSAINLFGVLFVHKGVSVTDRLIRHESIHTAQMREMLYLPFYVWYVLEWIFQLFAVGNAYRNISFEREAYMHETEAEYLEKRKKFAWVEYLRDNKKYIG